MKITGLANMMPGESLSQPKTDAIEAPPPPMAKITEVASGNSANNNSLKQGLARVFEKIKLNQISLPPSVSPPPNPFERGDRRKKAVAKYRRVIDSEDKSGQKLNKAA